jgi:hypothetical protein
MDHEDIIREFGVFAGDARRSGEASSSRGRKRQDQMTLSHALHRESQMTDSVVHCHKSSDSSLRDLPH